MFRLTFRERTKNMAGMPFDDPRVDILFCIRMGLMHCRTSPKPERNERVRRVQAEAMLDHLERCGYRVVKIEEDSDVKPSNIGE
jgi:hypothetical protein